MKLYDALSERLVTVNLTDTVRLYSCGPTVYDYIHIGNARPVLLVDTIVRYLRHKGVTVNYLQNITDIDDKIIHKAQLQQVDETVVSRTYREAYAADLQRLGVILPTANVAISEKMPAMVNFISELVATDDAYVSHGNVYFDLTRHSDEYGRLSRQQSDALLAGERVEADTYKQNPLDFALWKATEVGVKFASPFGAGRPGWHTECAVLIKDYYGGTTIDLHVGGVDLKFPHHENERIQFLANTKRELARIWAYNGHVTVDGTKMSKSLGNVTLVKDFVAVHGAAVLRWIFLTSNYQRPLNITDDLVAQGQTFLTKLEKLRIKLRGQLITHNLTADTLTGSAAGWMARFEAALDENLNTASALSLVEEAIKKLNVTFDNNALLFVQQALTLLGFENAFDLSINAADRQLFLTWQELVAAKRFAEADTLRTQLQEKKLV